MCSLLQVKSCEFKSSKMRQLCTHMSFNATCQLARNCKRLDHTRIFSFKIHSLSTKGSPDRKAKLVTWRAAERTPGWGAQFYWAFSLRKLGAQHKWAFATLWMPWNLQHEWAFLYFGTLAVAVCFSHTALVRNGIWLWFTPVGAFELWFEMNYIFTIVQEILLCNLYWFILNLI